MHKCKATKCVFTAEDVKQQQISFGVCVSAHVSLSLFDDLLQIELGVLHLVQVLYGHLQVSFCLSPCFLHLRPYPLLLLPAVLQLHTHTHTVYMSDAEHIQM